MKRILFAALVALAALLPALSPGQGIYPLPGSDLDLNRPIASASSQARFIGWNLTDGACFPPIAEAKFYADALRRKGGNLLRFHHVDRILSDNPGEFPKLHNFARTWAKGGGRYTLDLYSKGREHIEGNDAFKLKCYEMNPEALAWLEANARKLLLTVGPDGTRLIDDQNLFAICLVNEGATPLNYAYGAGSAAMADRFYAWGQTMLRGLGYRGHVIDLPDGSIDAARFAPVASKMGLAAFHTYGDDARDLWRSYYWLTGWAVQGWQWGTNTWYVDMAGKRGFVQEYGSLPYNPYRSANTLFAVSEINRKQYHSAAFAWASNMNFMAGDAYWVDWTNLATDLARVVPDTAGLFLARYDSRQKASYFWGHDVGTQSENYDYNSTTVAVNIRGDNGYAVIATAGTLANPKRLMVFTVGPTESFGLESARVNDFQRQVIQHGRAGIVAQYRGLPVPLGKPPWKIYALNPFTGAREAELPFDAVTRTFSPIHRVSVSLVLFD